MCQVLTQDKTQIDFYPPFKKMSIPNLKYLNHEKNKNKEEC